MEKTTQEKLTKGLAELKVQVEEWYKGEFPVKQWEQDEYKEQLELEMHETVRELIFETVEADKSFIEPEECRDTDRSAPAYVCAVAAHAEELADTLDDEDNANALRVLVSYWKKNAHISGLTPALNFDELVWAFNIK